MATTNINVHQATVPLRNMNPNAAQAQYPGKTSSASVTPGSETDAPFNANLAMPGALMSPTTPGSCPEYGQEILEHFMLRERTMMRNPSYLANQPEVTERMRCILLDWMVDVHIKFKLHPETFFLAVDITDRYLAGTQVTRAKLQLVGVTATLLAAKHEEIWPPEVKDCIYIAANTYSRDEILEAEREISNYLQFKLAVPTSYPIMSYLLDLTEADSLVKNTALMFLELSAIDFGSLRYLPSINAFAAVLLSNLMCHPSQDSSFHWPRLLEQVTRTEYATIVPAAEQMLQFAQSTFGSGSKYQATRRKFSSSKYLEVATRALPAAVPLQ